MNSKLKVIALTILLFFIFADLALPCQSQETSSEQISKNTYKAFLTDVLCVDLSQYNISKSGYGVNYPEKFGGVVREETISYTFNSGQSTVNAWCIIDNGNISACSMYAVQGSVIFNQPQPIDLAESTRNFMQNYERFTAQFYGADTTYIQQLVATIGSLNSMATSTSISVGSTNLRVRQSTNFTNIEWTYAQPDYNATAKKIVLKFEDGHISWLTDTWNLYSVNSGAILPVEDAEPFAFDEVQNNHNVTFTSFEGGTMIPVPIKPDWSNMKYKADLQMVPGKALLGSLPPVQDNIYPTKIDRDPLILYPLWHFIFYFNKPIGNTIGVEVGVWADTKEIAYCQDYGHLGGAAMSTSQAVSGTTNILQYILVTIGVITAILVGSYLTLRRRIRQ